MINLNQNMRIFLLGVLVGTIGFSGIGNVLDIGLKVIQGQTLQLSSYAQEMSINN